MNLLITGGAGFIGSNFIEYLFKQYPTSKVVNLDLLTYAGNLDNLTEYTNYPNYTFIKGDICNRELVEELFERYEFDGIIHFAAESHVDNSIVNPDAFVSTNVYGTFILLDVARRYWMDGPSKVKEKFTNARFHHISTDEVFGSLDNKGYFTEKSPYAPNSPYSASKAASDMLVRSYYQTYGLNVVITNCSNNFGPKQHGEKFIPTIIRSALAFQHIPIYGTGQNIRDWLFVEDHCRAIDIVFKNGKSGETYLIGGNNEKTNLELAYDICTILDQMFPNKLTERGIKSFKNLIEFVEDRAGHDYRYAIDSKKIKNELNWSASSDYLNTLRETIMYYVEVYSL